MQRSRNAIAQAGNLFVFTMNNPVRWIDPTGLFAQPIGSPLPMPEKPYIPWSPRPADWVPSWLRSDSTPASTPGSTATTPSITAGTMAILQPHGVGMAIWHSPTVAMMICPMKLYELAKKCAYYAKIFGRWVQGTGAYKWVANQASAGSRWVANQATRGGRWVRDGVSGIFSRGGTAPVQQGVNFTQTTMARMNDPSRYVPVQTLIKAINYGTVRPDPQGTRAMMHTIEMFKNNHMYVLEVLYDAATNTIWHFKYFR